MRKIRIIPRLDIKGPNLIKGIHLEGLRVLGDPQKFAKKYYDEGADELIYMDAVASLYGRNNLTEIVERTAHDIFIPLTVGGGIRSVEDVKKILRAGADKVAVNTAAIQRPELITEISNRFGAQCMVASIEAQRVGPDQWEARIDCGREKTGVDAVQWAKRAESLGAGEILVTSIDQEGTRSGYDVPLLKAISAAVSIPVIASGGMGNCAHFTAAVNESTIEAISMASVLHYNLLNLDQIRAAATAANIHIRRAVS